MADRPPPVEKPEIITAMRLQVAENGVVNVPSFQKQYPHIAKGTLWRWARLVNENLPTGDELRASYRELESRIDGGAAAHLPTVSPGILARGGNRALRQIDYAAELDNLWLDADKLRSFAIKPGENASEDPEDYKIRNPVQFEKSMRVRMSLIESGLKLTQEVWDMRTMQMFYEMIVDEIGKESLEAQKRIIVRLAELNRRHGMTMAMRI